jgi:hypothetical protein
LDGDGKADVLFKNTDGSIYGWIMNGLAISNGGVLIGPSSGWSVSHVRDLDGDGKGDILLKHTDGRAYAWQMNGLSVTGAALLLETGSPWSVAP